MRVLYKATVGPRRLLDQESETMAKQGKGKARGGTPADACCTLSKSPKKSPMLWPEVTTEEYARMSPSDKETIRVEAAAKHQALEEAAAEEITRQLWPSGSGAGPTRAAPPDRAPPWPPQSRAARPASVTSHRRLTAGFRRSPGCVTVFALGTPCASKHLPNVTCAPPASAPSPSERREPSRANPQKYALGTLKKTLGKY